MNESMQAENCPFFSYVVRFNPDWPYSLEEMDVKEYAWICEHLESKGGAIMACIRETYVSISIRLIFSSSLRYTRTYQKLTNESYNCAAHLK